MECECSTSSHLESCLHLVGLSAALADLAFNITLLIHRVFLVGKKKKTHTRVVLFCKQLLTISVRFNHFISVKSSSGESSACSVIMPVEYVRSMSEFQGIVNGSPNKLVVVDFTATWCGPCRAIAPHYESLSQRYQNRSRFLKVDVDEAQDIAQFCSVSAMPTFHFYLDGKKVAHFSGADPNMLDRTVEQHAPSSADVSFAGAGQRLGAPSGNTQSSLREAAALAASRRMQDSADTSQGTGTGAAGTSSVDRGPDGGTPGLSLPKNDPRLKVNETLAQQMVEEMGFPRVRAEKALILTGNKGLEDAVEWCFEHADDADVDEPLQVVLDGGADSKPTISPEEAKRRADELATKARAKREADEKRDAIEREKQRIRSGKEISTVKAKLEDEERRRAVEAKRRQKLEDLAERQRVREMLEADKEARRRKFNMPSPLPPPPSRPNVSPRAPRNNNNNNNNGKIQFRLPDGSRLEGEFNANQTMGDVMAFLSSTRPELGTRAVKLSQQYPRKVFSQADYASTLGELNLLPQGALTVTFS